MYGKIQSHLEQELQEIKENGHKAHERDCPDTHSSTRKTARDALVDGGFVVIADGICWINSELGEL